MSCHGANPILFNKKIKIGRPEHLLSPPPPTSNNISFLPYPRPPIPPQYGLHMCITPKRVHTKVIDLIILLVLFNFEG